MYDSLAAAVLALSAALTAWLGRDWLFFHDEWGFIFYRRSGGIETYLAPYHGQLFAGVFAIYNALFDTVGLHHYGAYRGVEIALQVVCAGLLYCYARRRGVQPVVALLAFVPLVCLGPAWEDVLWLASADFIIPVIALLATLLLWDSKVRGTNIGTAVLCVIALGSGALGVAIVGGLIVASLGKPRDLRRWLALGIPSLAWTVWFLAIRRHLSVPASLRDIPGASRTGDMGSLGVSTAHLSQLPMWMVNSVTGAAAALAGREAWFGVGLALVFALMGGAFLAYRRGALDGWRFCGSSASLVLFWMLTGVARIQRSSPSASRYLYPGVALLLVLAIECMRDLEVRTSIAGILIVLLSLSAWSHIDVLQGQANSLTKVFDHERVVLSDLESCRGELPPTFLAVQGVTAGPFWAATSSLGQPVAPAPANADPMCPKF